MPKIKIKMNSDNTPLKETEVGFNSNEENLIIGLNDQNFPINSCYIRNFISSDIPTTVVDGELIYVTDLNCFYIGHNNSYIKTNSIANSPYTLSVGIKAYTSAGKECSSTLQYYALPSSVIGSVSNDVFTINFGGAGRPVSNRVTNSGSTQVPFFYRYYFYINDMPMKVKNVGGYTTTTLYHVTGVSSGTLTLYSDYMQSSVFSGVQGPSSMSVSVLTIQLIYPS